MNTKTNQEVNNLIFAAIEAAKNARDYVRANVLFSVLLWGWYEHKQQLVLSIESDDEKGDAADFYYDLIVIEDGTGNYACIPAPLVSPAVFMLAAKRGVEVKPRKAHRRDYSTQSSDDIEKAMNAFNTVSNTQGRILFEGLFLLSEEVQKDMENFKATCLEIDQSDEFDPADERYLGESTLAALREAYKN